MIVKSDSNTTIGKVILASGDTATFSTIGRCEIVAKIDLLKADGKMEAYYLKQTGKGNFLMNKNIKEKQSNKE